ncbi:MAG TPA: alpha/beta fold hydrolase [Actinomycetota bacterium]|nr:alpha/beta fold hydrolase [Actinomycetota bacterium]
MTDVVFIHAFPVDASMWERQVADLAGEASALAPNLPGFGREPPPEGPLTVGAMADAVAAAMDRRGLERAVIAGCSMGGYAAFEMWRRHRGRVAGLLLVDTRAEPDDDEGRRKRLELAEKVREQGSEVVVESPPPLLSPGAPADLWKRVKEWIARQPADSIAWAALGMGERPDSRPDLPAIDVPTTVVVGSEDTLTPPRLSEAMAEQIPGAELVVLEGAGHLSNLEDPEGFLEAVRGLLRRT